MCWPLKSSEKCCHNLRFCQNCVTPKKRKRAPSTNSSMNNKIIRKHYCHERKKNKGTRDSNKISNKITKHKPKEYRRTEANESCNYRNKETEKRARHQIQLLQQQLLALQTKLVLQPKNRPVQNTRTEIPQKERNKARSLHSEGNTQHIVKRKNP